MKPFAFKLQTSLDVKLKREEIQKEELSKVTKIYRENADFLADLRNRLIDLQQILREKQTEHINVPDIMNYQDYIPVLIARIKQQEIITEEFHQAMERERQKLVGIMRERKVLEKLKTKHYQAYIQECLREEQKLIDEMATVGFMHKDSAV